MSGIVRFFGSALPLHREGGDASAVTGGEAQPQAEAAEYGRSLLPSPEAEAEADPPAPPPPAASSPAAAPAVAAAAPALTYGEWSALRRRALERYMSRRLLATPREEAEDTGGAGAGSGSPSSSGSASSPAGSSMSSGSCREVGYLVI